MAVLHNKNDYYGGYEKPKKKADKIDKTVFDFLDDTLTEYNKENVLMHKGTPIYFTPDFDVKNVTAFSVGVTIGEIKKNYIIICGPWAKRNPASLKPAGIFCAVIFLFLQRRHAVPRRAWLAEPQHGSPFPWIRFLSSP